ncbi:hypothetical protein HYFRA_00009738 [Hymenoscyphus fraxineus]|uniref:Uncharacterized protein n=1 Tax=Hymenoscyphus fraxineus TaxID=746836 RepID=A0A9N9KSB0_9HELO|nr:hypothetical protein HYFRA_00009738 [Hymenoscyphus fraxineus]
MYTPPQYHNKRGATIHQVRQTIFIPRKTSSMLEQSPSAVPELQDIDADHHQELRKLKRKIHTLEAELEKSNAEKHVVLGKFGELKGELKASNDITDELIEEVVELRIKFEKRTDERDAALSRAGQLNATVKLSENNEEELRKEATKLRAQLEKITEERDNALGKVGQLKAQLKETTEKATQIVENQTLIVTNEISTIEPDNKKRKLDDIDASSIKQEPQDGQEAWIASVEELRTKLLLFNFMPATKPVHKPLLSYLTSLLFSYHKCESYDPKDKGLHRSKRMRNLERYKAQVEPQYEPNEWQCFVDVIFGHNIDRIKYIKGDERCSTCVERESGCIQIRNINGALWMRCFREST